MADLNENRPGYKKTKVGWIPEEWDLTNLDSILEESRLGGNYSNREAITSRPLVKMGNIERGKISLDKLQYIPDDEKVDEQDLLSEGDLLFNTRNTLELVGKVAVWRNELPKAYYNSNLLRLNFQPDKVASNYFVNYVMNSHPSLSQLWGFATGTTSVAAIYNRDLKRLKIPLPPLPEQRGIARILSTWDATIDKLGQLITKKQALKKGLMQQLLSGRVRFPEFVPPGGTRYKETKVGLVPEDWEVMKLQNISKPVSRKNTAQEAEVVLTASAQHGLVDQISFFNKSVSGKDLSKYYLLKKGEFAYNRSYSTGYDFGAIKRLEDYKEGVLSTLYICFSVDDEDISNYLTYYFETRLIQRELFSIVQEGARNHGLLNVAKSDFYEVKILLPPKEEMRKIFSFLNEVDTELTKLKQEKSSLQTQKKGLMQQLLTGAVRVKEDMVPQK